MISRTIFCSAQAATIRPARTGPMPVNFPQPIGLRLDDVEHLLAESAQQLLGVGRADAADHAGGKIFLDAFNRGRLRGLKKLSPELLAVGTVVGPVPRCGDPFAGRYCGSVPDYGDQVAMAPRLDPNDTKPVLSILVGDALDHPASTSRPDGLGCDFIMPGA